MTEQELAELIAVGERPGVEFKNARARADNNFWEVVRAALGMANRRDGGVIVVGVNRDGTTTGLTPVQAQSWVQTDELKQALAPYADPFVYVDVEVLQVKLVVDDPRRMPLFRRPYAADIDEFPVAELFTRAQLLADPVSLAVASAQRLFERFGWDQSEESLRDWLSRLRRT